MITGLWRGLNLESKASFLSNWGQFCNGRWTQASPQKPEGWVEVRMWGGAAALKHHKHIFLFLPRSKAFIRPAMKDSVSLSGPSFTVPCPGSTPIPDRHSAAAWSLLLLRWSQIPLGFLFFGSFEPKPSFVRTLQTCGSFSLWTVDSVISTPISPMSAALCCSFLVPCGCAGGGPFLGMVIPLQILLFESGFVPMWR